MAKRGAPIGNRNSSTDNRLWADTIRRVAIQDGDRLRKIVEKTYRMAEEGDMQAIKEIGDRLDGKPHQTIAAEVDSNVTVEVVRFGTGKTAK